MQENGKLTVLSMQDILPNRFQPRFKFDEEKLEELALSISKYGVIQPIVVRPVSNKYEIIAGERRFKASKLANRSTIPAIVINLSDKDSEEIALLENVQRQQLNPIEEAVSYKRILDMGYITQEELAKKIGTSQLAIVNKIKLLSLSDEVQSYLLNNKISERHARSLLRVTDKEMQVQLLYRIVKERLTVKQTDKEIAKIKENENKFEMSKQNINSNQEVKKIVEPIETEAIESLFDESENLERGNHMDIDKIMREAKDINVPTKEEPKDISNLMVSGVDVQSEPIVRQESASTPLEPGKFINVQPQAQVQEKPISPVQTDSVTFDSVFNQGLMDTPNKTVSQPINNLQNNVNSQTFVKPQASINSSASSDLNSKAEPQHNTFINSNLQNNSSVSDSVVQAAPSVPNVSDSVEISDDTKNKISNAVAMALKGYNSRRSGIGQVSTVAGKSVQSNVSNNFNAQPQGVPAKPVMPQTNNIPDVDIIADNNINDYIAPTPTGDSTIAASMSQSIKPVNNHAHFAQIVKMLRDCADKIEQEGYFVNVDEMDLNDKYKVTFTINKE